MADKKLQTLQKKAKAAANTAADISKDVTTEVKAKVEKATATEEKVPAFDPSKFPPEWTQPKAPLGPAPVVGMHQKFEV
jgi:hypothetical protein